MTKPLPPTGTRGPRRPVDEARATAALDAARKATRDVTRAQRAVEAAAARRHAAIANAVDAGLSIRQVAAALEVSQGVIQNAVGAATRKAGAAREPSHTQHRPNGRT